MKLLSGPVSLFGGKVEIALREKGLPFELEMVPFDFAQGYQPKHPEVLRVNPHKRQVPVLLDGEVELYDSTQIFEYLEDLGAGAPLWPRDLRLRARARRLELECDEVFFPWIMQRMRRPENDEEKGRSRAAKASAIAHYPGLNDLLEGQAWLAGELSYADIGYYMAILFAQRLGCPPPQELAHLHRWRERLAQRPAFACVTERVLARFAAA